MRVRGKEKDESKGKRGGGDRRRKARHSRMREGKKRGDRE